MVSLIIRGCIVILPPLNICHRISYDGTPLDVFESDHLKEPTFSWNPPICDTLMAVCKNDIDDQIDFDFDDSDTDYNGLQAADSSAEGDTSSPVDAVIQVSGVPPGLDNVTLSPVANQNDNTIDVFAKTNTIAGSSTLCLLMQSSSLVGELPAWWMLTR